MKKGLHATQLKIIAILAMVCDHTAWGFVEMFSVKGQIMHVIGRLTLPIMCFFIAEGYRKTANLRTYIYRMTIFAMLTVVPFYLFFGEEYGYRQNIIFDLLLALLTLTVVHSSRLRIVPKILLTALLFVTSAAIGGWPVLPILFVLIFYYGKSFRQKAALICGTVLILEAFVICFSLLNQQYHFASYDWVWYQWMYFLGFILALPLLRLYNGERGRYPLGKYFFYLFYPCHFLLLYSIKQLTEGNTYHVYLLIHVLALLVTIALIVKLIFLRPSRALVISIVMASSAVIYVFGFVIEILTDSADIAYTGTVMEYFGECLVILCFLAFMAELCRKKIPTILFFLGGMFSAVIVTLVVTTRTNHYFYTSVKMNYSGTFHRIDLEYGVGFYLFIAYLFLTCGSAFVIGIVSMIQGHGLEKKRIRMVLIAILCPWFAFLLKLLGLTGGYEISALGVCGSLFFVYKSIVSYGYFDSVQLAGENALHHIEDGILVVDSVFRVLYCNQSMKNLFPEIHENTDARLIPVISGLLDGSGKSLKRDDHIYNATITPLEEHGHIQGYLLSVKDMTEHYLRLEETERFARTDALTGLSNRGYFKTCFNTFRANGGVGCMLMFDLDNFKGVNDRLGHNVGDAVLVALSDTLRSISGEHHLACRMGGDEFCIFLKDIIDEAGISRICRTLIDDFRIRLTQAGHEGLTSVSIGAAVLDTTVTVSMEEDFSAVYKAADHALYQAKNSGKATFCIANR